MPNQAVMQRPDSVRLNDWIFDHAMTYIRGFNMSVVPVDGKLPTVKWKHYQLTRPTVDEMRGWQWPGVGIITGAVSNLVVVDCDSMDAAKWFWSNGGKTSTLVRTKRGVHFYFRHPGFPVKNATHVNDRYDIRGDGGLVIAPPSPHREWIDTHGLQHQHDLPPFRAEWLPTKDRGRSPSGPAKSISCPEAYISRIRAVSGHDGHGATFKAVSYLRDAGLSKTEAAMVLGRWNQANAKPPWSDEELAHKLEDVFG